MVYGTIVHPPITSHDIMVVSFVSLGVCVCVFVSVCGCVFVSLSLCVIFAAEDVAEMKYVRQNC